jgi:hypothetical protein
VVVVVVALWVVVAGWLSPPRRVRGHSPRPLVIRGGADGQEVAHYFDHEDDARADARDGACGVVQLGEDASAQETLSYHSRSESW